MAGIQELRQERERKLAILRAHGKVPYPSRVARDLSLSDVIQKFTTLSKRTRTMWIAGRVTALRAHGGSLFCDIKEGADKLQVYVKQDTLPEEFALFRDTVDIGDFISARGTLFLTKKRERTLEVREWQMAAKALRPLPDKRYGLEDVEERYRKRYLDILVNTKTRERFLFRSMLIREIRVLLEKEGYIEMETPILQPLAGGATAAPFKTRHNALGRDLFLRIAPELYLKELLVAGYSRIYELGRNFRNEGVDVMHNPEFTALEVYTAYATAETERTALEKFLKKLVSRTRQSKKITYDGKTIDFSRPFKTIRYRDVITKYTLLSQAEYGDREAVALKAKQFGIPVLEHEDAARILDNIFKKVCRPKITEPTFVIDYPLSSAPLARKKEGAEDVLDRFQLVVGGLEIVNGFQELNDPQEQTERFQAQEEKRGRGDEEAQPKDAAFIEALEYGMPPACGWGIGIDRLVMLLSDVQNIRDVILFPALRPK